MLIRATLLCMGVVLDAGAHELQEAARGLAVSIEDLAGTIGVNGLPLAVSRVVGPAVPTMAERLIGRWREDSGSEAVRLSGCCGWQIASRIRSGYSQVIQWRTTAEGSELYLSTANLMDPAGPAPRVTAPLPSGCAWTTPVHGRISTRMFIQASAQCELPATVILDLSIRRLSSDGWRWHRAGAGIVRAERGTAQLQVIAFPQPAGAHVAHAGKSAIVIVETRQDSGRGR